MSKSIVCWRIERNSVWLDHGARNWGRKRKVREGKGITMKDVVNHTRAGYDRSLI